jgi:hypothetical protein
MLADREMAERLGQCGREVVLREYDLDREAALLAAFYHSVIDDELADRINARPISIEAFRQGVQPAP